MLKSILLASAVMISAPAFAQDAPVPGRVPQNTATPPVDTSTAPTETPAASETPTQDSVTAQTPRTTTDAPAPTASARTAAATPTAGAPAAGAAQIAQVVNTEFPSYDKDANGALNKVEFGSWMVALKTASDPATKATDPATQTWVGNAFASADVDKSAAVSKDELTKFLSQGAE
jgi:hypothetical protein